MSEDCALYRHFDVNGTLLYIGISDNPFRRAEQHRATDWSDNIADFRIEWYPTREAAIEAEREAIRKENPIHNKQHLTRPHYIKPEPMTAAEFIALHQRLGISRGELCRQIGIAPNSGTAYALGRKPIPLTVALACAQIEQG
jgi:predicted GIY-YIG superfamily endonuclease